MDRRSFRLSMRAYQHLSGTQRENLPPSLLLGLLLEVLQSSLPSVGLVRLEPDQLMWRLRLLLGAAQLL